MIRDVMSSDAAAICAIYNHYVEKTVVTFEEKPVTAEQMQERITAVTAEYPWLVLVENDELIGYAYIGPFHRRSAYRSTVECTIYLHPEYCGGGRGKRLFAALLERVQQLTRPVHSIIACLGLPNDASAALHERFGFKKVGHLTEAGYKVNRWVDVGYWQLLLG